MDKGKYSFEIITEKPIRTKFTQLTENDIF